MYLYARHLSNKRLPHLLLALLMISLAACTNAGQHDGDVNSSQTGANTNLTKAAEDICPAQLKSIPTCLTPHAVRVAYGMESLIEHGMTGKGETIIDIVSFGSPTLQQDMDVFNKQFGLPPIHL